MIMARAAGSTVLTIGHSNHSLEVFLALLARHGVTALADVRSVPSSRFTPHFNRASLTATLKMHGIEYVYFGGELGGRSNDPACYENGRIRYDRLARTDSFSDALARVVQGSAKHRIALMCAEQEPLDCHRTLLVAHALDERGVDVAHILPDGEPETHADSMDRLLDDLDMRADSDMFRQLQPRAELIAAAIARQAERVAFVDDGSASVSVRAG